jgi:hypothetical protein
MVVGIGMADDHWTTLDKHFVSLWCRWLISPLRAPLAQVSPELTLYISRSSSDGAERVTIDVWVI